MKKWTAGILAAMLLAGCGSSTNEEGAGEAGGSEEMQDVSLMLDWYPNAVHSFLYVAEEKGYFKEEGINLDIQFPANATDPIGMAASDQVTMAITYQPDVIVARTEQNVGVKSVGTIVREPLNRVVSLAESNIKSPKDLEGKTVGYTGIPLNESIVKTMVEEDGGDPSKVELVDVGFELNSTLISKRADAVVGAYINHEVPLLEFEGYQTANFDLTEYGVPSFYELIAVTSDKTWEENPELIQAFWRAAEKGFADMKANPDEALDILMANQETENFPLEEEVEKESMAILLPLMEGEQGFGYQEEEPWQETADWMKETGLIQNDPVIDDLYVNMPE
ncbi:ABC transporter substrate-binding protein [Domibacillus enclensis]|uniref:ABC transporter substrate-binding protein n=1 Tax=Domibacillus enclensis TaxID=1017273 RepID=A0A1N6WMX1_9BACI|nr:ABC transporter substrate-binding protein [Domibacillus enclensis]OXS77987.1 ABC transporter substrate-binding protein [Domibacillus enclensis]SIQ91433.1 putative hydroxymethylpyrimidine transport system substrate-binding protein [Domibacillus enclensis]